MTSLTEKTILQREIRPLITIAICLISLSFSGSLRVKVVRVRTMRFVFLNMNLTPIIATVKQDLLEPIANAEVL